MFLKLFEHTISKEGYFNKLDADTGDGDMGTGVSLAGKELIKINSSRLDEPQFIDEYLFEMGDNMARVMGGSSGPFYAAFLMRWAVVFKQARQGSQNWKIVELIYRSFEEGKAAIQYLGRAEYTDRTMLYVLDKISVSLKVLVEKENLEKVGMEEIWQVALKSAEIGC